MIDFERILLDFRAKIPLYRQLSEQLRGQIEHGALQADEQLPPVRALAQRLRVNFNTVARAYRLLDIEGWISTQQGRGTYITIQTWPRALNPAMQPPADGSTPESILVDDLPQSALTANEFLPQTILPEPAEAPGEAASGEVLPSEPMGVLLAHAASMGISEAGLLAYLLQSREAGQVTPNRAALAIRRSRKDDHRRRMRVLHDAREITVSALRTARQTHRAKKRRPVQ